MSSENKNVRKITKKTRRITKSIRVEIISPEEMMIQTKEFNRGKVILAI